MTTTSLKEELEATSETETSLPVMLTCWVVKFTEEKTRVVILLFTEIRKVPSAAVTTPLFEPFGTTDTPCTGVPSFESVTFPVMVLVCALVKIHRDSMIRRMVILTSNRFFLILMQLYELKIWLCKPNTKNLCNRLHKV